MKILMLMLVSLLGVKPLFAADSKINWQIVPRIEKDKVYRVQLNYLKLKDPKDVTQLREYTEKVVAQLNQTEGALQFALFAKPEKLEFWTLSVWKDEDAMKAFGRSKPHSEAVKTMYDKLADLNFDAWDLKGSELMSDWKDIIK